jgi:hypothetical protein
MSHVVRIAWLALVPMLSLLHRRDQFVLAGEEPVLLHNVATALTCRFWQAAYAARWYSLITPPRIFRRCTSVSKGVL